MSGFLLIGHSDDFSKRFIVKCTDRKFPNDLGDSRMIQWLLGVDGPSGSRSTEPGCCATGSRLRPSDLVPLVASTKRFVGHVPRVVFELYGTGAGR